MLIFERIRHGTAEAADPAGGSGPADDGVRELAFRSRRRADTSYRLRFQPGERDGFVHARGWWLHVSTPTGLAIFTRLAALLRDAPSLGLATALERLEDIRPVAFLAFDEATETIHFGRSLDGFASLYFGSNAERLVIADAAPEVARRLGPVRLSAEDKAQWCAGHQLQPEGSFYAGVKRSFAGTRYTASAEATPKLTRLMAPDAQTPPAEPVQLLTDGLREMFAEYGDRKVALRLSGGVDSRVLLVGLMDAVREGILHRDQILCTSVLFPGFDCDESAVIRQVIEFSGFEWVGIEATREKVQQAWQECSRLPMPPFPTSFMGALCMEAAKQRDAQVMLSGHGGDEVFDFTLSDLLAKPLIERLRRLPLIRQLRQGRTLVDEAKVLVLASVGLHASRSRHRNLNERGLPPTAVTAWRIETRLGLGRGTGYEMSAVAAARRELLTDALLFRGPFIRAVDPADIRRSGFRFKEAAFRYMHSRRPELATLPTRKVGFDQVVNRFLSPGDPDCDEVDTRPAGAYAMEAGYVQWHEYCRVAAEK